LLAILLGCFFASGCAITPQEAVLSPTVAVKGSSIGNNLAVALEVADERSGKLAGTRATLGAQIILEDVKSPVEKEIRKGLEGNGFKPVAHKAQISRRLRVEVRTVELRVTMSFVTFGYFPRAAIKAVATNAGQTYQKFYRAEKEERSLIVNTEIANNRLLSEVFSDVLSQIVNDQQLMRFLAK
jgi:uncharacterized lipoprotein YajG